MLYRVKWDEGESPAGSVEIRRWQRFDGSPYIELHSEGQAPRLSLEQAKCLVAGMRYGAHIEFRGLVSVVHYGEEVFDLHLGGGDDAELLTPGVEACRAIMATLELLVYHA